MSALPIYEAMGCKGVSWERTHCKSVGGGHCTDGRQLEALVRAKDRIRTQFFPLLVGSRETQGKQRIVA